VRRVHGSLPLLVRFYFPSSLSTPVVICGQ
jgi:hypothetical protein